MKKNYIMNYRIITEEVFIDKKKINYKKEGFLY